MSALPWQANADDRRKMRFNHMCTQHSAIPTRAIVARLRTSTNISLVSDTERYVLVTVCSHTIPTITHIYMYICGANRSAIYSFTTLLCVVCSNIQNYGKGFALEMTQFCLHFVYTKLSETVGGEKIHHTRRPRTFKSHITLFYVFYHTIFERSAW